MNKWLENKWIISVIIIIILCASCLIGYAMQLHAQKPDICQDSIEIRTIDSSELQCHKDATVSYEPYRTGAFSKDGVVVKCTCKR